MRRLSVIVLGLVLVGAPLAAQTPVTVRATDTSTGATTNVGDATNKALRVNLVGTNAVRVQDGAGNNLTSLSLGAQRAITVAVVDGAGSQITAFGGSGGTASNYGSAFPASGTAAGFSDGTNLQGARVIDLDTGAGTVYGLVNNLVRRASGGPVELIGSATAANSIPVVLASDQAASAGMGVAATGAAVPTNANYVAGVGGGATGGLLLGVPVCESQAFLNMTTATTTEFVALTAGQTIHVCHIRVIANGTTTVTFKRGTGANCGTGTTAVDADYNLTAQVGYVAGSGFGEVLNGGAAANALCLTSSAAVNVGAFVRYAKY